MKCPRHTPLCRMRTNAKRPLLPASGEKVRMRGRRRQWPGYRQRWRGSQGAARPSSPCRDLLPAGGEKEAVILEAAIDWKNPQKHGRSSPHPLCRMRTNVKRLLLPASGEKVRMRGERHQWPGYRQRWRSWQGAARPSSPCRDLLPAGGEKEAVIPGLTRDPLAECARARPGPHPRPWKRFSTCTGHRRGSTATRSKRSERRAWSGWRASHRSAVRSIRVCA